MKRAAWVILLLLCFASCKQTTETSFGYYMQLLPDFVKDSLLLDTSNVPSGSKVKLGRYLFYDNRLSVNNTKSCASCHDPSFSFTDSYRRSIGAYGDLTQHNAPPLINLIFNRYLTAADSSLHFPEQQIQNPMFRMHPVELGWSGKEQALLSRFKDDALYQKLFASAFPDEKHPVTVKNIQHSISSFIKTILSVRAPYDVYLYKKEIKAMSASSLRGRNLFYSDELKCNQCHSGMNFNQPLQPQAPYFNTGFFTDTALHKGLAAYSYHPTDVGKYKVPTLRNLAFTAPYLHDGSAETLEEVIRMYEQGGQPTAVNKHSFITGFKLNSQQRIDLISFLLSLSDSSVLKNPDYSNPFQVK